MKLGYFMMPLHHIDRDYHQTLQEDVEAVIYCDELGFSEAWVGEHYSSAVEQITSPVNGSTESAFRSVCTTTFATLRCTNSSPGSRSTI